MEKQRRFFGTDGIRGRVGKLPITPDFVLKLGWAFGHVLTKYMGTSKVLIGKDTRISGYMFESALEAGLTAAGVDSYLLGPMPTPAIAYMTRSLRAQAGIVISASHNPYYDNGIKFFSADGKKLSDEFEWEIEEQMDESMQTLSSEYLGKAVRVSDAAIRYIEYCKSTFPKEFSLKNLKIVLDCAHGATYHVAPVVFRELDAQVIDLAVNPNGFNINDQCGSLYPETLREIVLAENADMGIAFDGDGDRVIMIDHKGEFVDGDEMIFIIAHSLYQENKLSNGVVGTLMSNYGLEVALQNSGIDFVRSKVGDRYVLEELLSKGWVLGGENSGHIICLNIATTGDGIIAALQVLAAMMKKGQSLHEIKSGMKKLPQKLVNVPIKTCVNLDECSPIQSVIQLAQERLKDRGRVLLRASGTEPVVRVMVEGEDITEISAIAEEVSEVVKRTLKEG